MYYNMCYLFVGEDISEAALQDTVIEVTPNITETSIDKLYLFYINYIQFVFKIPNYQALVINDP